MDLSILKDCSTIRTSIVDAFQDMTETRIVVTAEAILEELKVAGDEKYKRILLNHGVTQKCFGVKIEILKKIQKRIKKDYQLALELFETGVYDAMYLAGLIADDLKMTQRDLDSWVKKSQGPLAGSTVPWVTAGSPKGKQLALKWIDSKKEYIAGAGWATLSSLVSIKADDELDIEELKQLLVRTQKTIHQCPNEVRYQMNMFVISVGCYIKSLTKLAIEIGEKIGVVSVDMGHTACKAPFAPDYIRKVETRGSIGKKRKSAKC